MLIDVPLFKYEPASLVQNCSLLLEHGHDQDADKQDVYHVQRVLVGHVALLYADGRPGELCQEEGGVLFVPPAEGGNCPLGEATRVVSAAAVVSMAAQDKPTNCHLS